MRRRQVKKVLKLGIGLNSPVRYRASTLAKAMLRNHGGVRKQLLAIAEMLEKLRQSMAMTWV